MFKRVVIAMGILLQLSAGALACSAISIAGFDFAPGAPGLSRNELPPRDLAYFIGRVVKVEDLGTGEVKADIDVLASYDDTKVVTSKHVTYFGRTGCSGTRLYTGQIGVFGVKVRDGKPYLGQYSYGF